MISTCQILNPLTLWHSPDPQLLIFPLSQVFQVLITLFNYQGYLTLAIQNHWLGRTIRASQGAVLSHLHHRGHICQCKNLHLATLYCLGKCILLRFQVFQFYPLIFYLVTYFPFILDFSRFFRFGLNTFWIFFCRKDIEVVSNSKAAVKVSSIMDCNNKPQSSSCAPARNVNTSSIPHHGDHCTADTSMQRSPIMNPYIRGGETFRDTVDPSELTPLRGTHVILFACCSWCLPHLPIILNISLF